MIQIVCNDTNWLAFSIYDTLMARQDGVLTDSGGGNAGSESEEMVDICGSYYGTADNCFYISRVADNCIMQC